MKIIFSQKILNPGGEYPKSLILETRREYQSETAVASVNAVLFDRGNSRVNIIFILERAHLSESEAENFALSHAATLSAMAPADLSFGTASARYLASSAVPFKIKTEVDSLITTTRYEFAAASLDIEL